MPVYGSFQASLADLSELPNVPDNLLKLRLNPFDQQQLASVDWQHLSRLTDLTSLDLRECYRLQYLPDPVCKLPSLQTLLIRGRSPKAFVAVHNVAASSDRKDRAQAANLKGGTDKAQLPQQQLNPKNHHPQATTDGTAQTLQKHRQEKPEQHQAATALCAGGPALVPAPKPQHYLTQLPDAIGKLTGLTALHISYCRKLQKLPQTLGNLTVLQFLDVSYCDVLESLPDSIGGLTGLKHFNFSNNGAMQQLPESLSLLVSLQILTLSWCTRLVALPLSVGALPALQQLSLRGCKGLLALPDSFGQLAALRELDIGLCAALTQLPASFCCLQSLLELNADSSGLVALPTSFGRLVALSILDVSSCSSLANLPHSCVSLTGVAEFKCTDCAAVPQPPPQRLHCCRPGTGYQQLRWVLKQQHQRAAVRKLANQQEPMLNTLERMSWLVVLLSTATFVAYLSPPGGVGDDKQVLVSSIASCACSGNGCATSIAQEALTGFTQCAMLVFFVLDGLSFGLSFGCLIMIVMLSMPRIQWADELAEAGRFYILLLCTWLLLYLAVVTGFAAFVASGLAVNRQAAVVVGPVVPGMVLLLLGAVFFWHRFQSLYPGWDALWAARPLQYRELAPVETDVELGQVKFWQEWPKYLSGLQQLGKSVPGASKKAAAEESLPLMGDAGTAPANNITTHQQEVHQQGAPPSAQVLCEADS